MQSSETLRNSLGLNYKSVAYPAEIPAQLLGNGLRYDLAKRNQNRILDKNGANPCNGMHPTSIYLKPGFVAAQLSLPMVINVPGEL